MRNPSRELPQDDLSDDEIEDLHPPMYTKASALEICLMADPDDPFADEIFYSWPIERQRAASQADREQWD